MQKTVIKFGLLAGLMIIVVTFVIATMCDQNLIGFDKAEYVGYAGMLVSLSMVFLGVRSFRDTQNGGIITFWKALQVGLLISSIAATLYFIGGELYNLANPGFGPRFMEKYTEYYLQSLRDAGSTEADVAAMAEQMRTIWGMMQNPLFRFGMALFEFLPVGIVVSLFSAAVLRRRTPEAAIETRQSGH